MSRIVYPYAIDESMYIIIYQEKWYYSISITVQRAVSEFYKEKPMYYGLWDIMTSASMRQLDHLLDVADREGVTEAISRMWRQKYSTEASVATLVKAISRVNHSI